MFLYFAAFASAAVASLVLWLRHIDRGFVLGTAEGREISPHRWTKQDIDDTCKKLEKTPLDWTPHLPPVQKRRYIVIGGSGLVGGTIILQLLSRGQDPKSIRNIDFAKPKREDLTKGAAAEVEWVHANVVSRVSVHQAFTQSWDTSVANLPITVFHTAALINAYMRKKIFMDKITPVNITGTENVIEVCKSVGADILIYTSTGSVPVRPLKCWLPPWKKHHDFLMQPAAEPGHETDIRDESQYFACYAATKARAERMVTDANNAKLRTGAIRPCNGIYGNKYDLCLGTYLKEASIPAWHEHVVTSYVRADNVAMGHLNYEAAILQNSTSGGKSFNVTDSGDAITAGDIFFLLNQKTGFIAHHISAAALLPLAYLIEWYMIAQATIPLLGKILPAPSPTLAQLQPALWNIMMSCQIASNESASRSPERGGIGYNPQCTTLEGMCDEVITYLKEKNTLPQRGDDALLTEIKNVPKAPVSAFTR